jgi:hypothetical protein
MGEDSGESAGSYRPAWKLRRGWQLWLGDHWAVIQAVRVRGDYVLITVAGGQVYRAGYADAVLSRTTPPGLARGRPADFEGFEHPFNECLEDATLSHGRAGVSQVCHAPGKAERHVRTGRS